MTNMTTELKECPGVVFKQHQGVRQGGPISPLLFNLTISNILLQRPASAIPNLFMDDLAIAVDINEVHQTITKVRRSVTDLG